MSHTRRVTAQEYAQEHNIAVTTARKRLKEICLREIQGRRRARVRGFGSHQKVNVKVVSYEIPA